MAWDERRRFGDERQTSKNLPLCVPCGGGRGRLREHDQCRDESARAAPIWPRRAHRLGGFELAHADALLLDTLDRMAPCATTGPAPMEAALAHSLGVGLQPCACRR